MKNIILNVKNFYYKKFNKNLQLKFLSYNEKKVEVLVWIKDIGYSLEIIEFDNIEYHEIELCLKIKIDITIEKILFSYISN